MTGSDSTQLTPAILEIDRRDDFRDPSVQDSALDALERGDLILLPKISFELTERERALVTDPNVILPGKRERESETGRPTLIFNPDDGRIERTNIKGQARREIEAMMGRFGEWANDVLTALIPSYGNAVERERVTYRPSNRSRPQGLHIDTSYGHPSRGRAMLRVFTNVNLNGRPRIWQVGERFEPFVSRFLPSVKPKTTSRGSWLLHRLGITRTPRTAYDELMADIRKIAKGNEDYQKDAPRRIIEFPAGASWIGITDLVVHGALSGQHSLDQNFFLPVSAMRDPTRSSLRILERLTGKNLI